ncbi:MAG: cytochrome c oxidase subunit II [Stappiaceae bacterium]
MGNAHAAQPEPWQLGFQPAATDVMDDISWFNDFTLVIATLVTLLVLGLLAICAVRFNRNANPEPSKTTHNTMIEVVWTIAPILILVIIAVPSFRLLYKELDIPEYDMTIKAVGYQWYWGYEYVDEGMEDLTIDSIMLDDEGRKERMAADSLTEQQVPRLLAADYNLVVPVDKTIRVQVTAADVIHAFAMPAFGVKIDAVPGRLNETWFKARETGMYYGQCSELCGKDHAFMPIALQVVTNEQFEKWSEAAKSDVDEANKLLAGLIKEEKLAKKRASEEVTVAER